MFLLNEYPTRRHLHVGLLPFGCQLAKNTPSVSSDLKHLKGDLKIDHRGLK